MPNVVRKELDNLTAEITVSLAKADYEPQFVAELKKYQKQGGMKGFRKGKTPISVLKKMYGGPLLADIVNKELSKTLNDYLVEEKILYIGQPIPSEKSPEVNLDPKQMEDLEFKFDLGLSPEIDLKGLNKNKKFTKYIPKISDKDIQKDIDAALKQLGERDSVTEDIKEIDSLTVSVKELDGKVLKEDGIESQFTVLVEKLTKKAKKQILSKKAGDSFSINIFDLEEGLDEKQVKKYFLKIEDENEAVGDKFELTIDEVTRVTPMEFNQTFFDKYFGEGSVSSEEEAKEKFGQPIKAHFESNVRALLFVEFQKHLMAKNDIELPNDFLKRSILLTNEGMTAETLKEEYDRFAESLKWDIIKGHLGKENKIEIRQEEIIAEAQNKVLGYFGGATTLPESMMKDMVERMLKDEKSARQIEDEIISRKLYAVLEEKFGFKEKEISIDELTEVIKKANEAAQKEQ